MEQGLVLAGVSKRYDDVEATAFLTILGPSGSGRTTIPPELVLES
jgi:ABC-type Fe3+/spermidine/putrescine transport system ATPase subunit